MASTRSGIRQALALALLLGARAAPADITVTLKNSFIEKYRRRATIKAPFIVDKAHREPNGIGGESDDGDMHIAGRSPAEIGLPMVAEIMNAKRYPAALAAVHGAEGTGNAVDITGVWRLWFEHPGTKNQVQGSPLGPDTSIHPTNPDHVFEIHPVTKFAGIDLVASFIPIKSPTREFDYKVASKAIPELEAKKFSVSPGPGNTTVLKSSRATNNYIHLKIAKLENQVFDLEDGAVVFASLYDLENHLLERKRRIVLVGGTPPEAVVRAAQTGGRIEVIAVPRISLSLVAYRAAHPASKDWNLPYELVIVAIK